MIAEEELDKLEATLDIFGMAEMLKNHYGDGAVYLLDGASPEVLVMAKAIGYVNEEGYLTRTGRKLVTQHRNHQSK
ncbi:MAG: hypothetical protein AB8D52_00165 [Gammaproteobacteria bacterium]